MKTWRLSSLCLCPHLQGVFSKLKFGGIRCTKDCAKAPFPNLLFQYPLLSNCVQKYNIMSVKGSEAGFCIRHALKAILTKYTASLCQSLGWGGKQGFCIMNNKGTERYRSTTTKEKFTYFVGLRSCPYCIVKMVLKVPR